MRRKSRLTGLLLIVVAASAAFWLWPRERPNLLLITLDTTRADRLGCYGCDAAQTPVLDALAAAGVLCERAYTVAPITLPAHASLLTGLYPDETGVRRNGHGRLENSIPALAEILDQRGYDTAAFVASFVLHRKFGLDRGFKVYDDDFWREGPSVEPEQRRRPGAAVVDSALHWLQSKSRRPFFGWIHFYDPHAPCSPHPEMFGDTFSNRPYDAEIAYTDRQVGRLIDHLKKQGLLEKTLVVIVGDHGESLGEHQELSHTLTLYNATMHVPLVFHHPAHFVGGRRLDMNLSVVDVFPTILEVLGVGPPGKVTGKSFHSALVGGTASPTRCYGATDDPFDAFGCAPLRSLIEGNWKYIRSTRPELYDLGNDPRELTNLAESHPEKRSELEASMAEFESQLLSRKETPVSLTASERRTLEGLGYTGATTSRTAQSNPRLPDIKDVLPYESDMDESKRLFQQRSAEKAIALLRNILQQAPTHAPAGWSLAWMLWKQGKPDEAMDIFHNLIAAWPECHVAHYGLGFMYLQRDQLEDAIPELKKAIEIDPENADAQLHLAESLFCTGQVEAAKNHLKLALESDPGNADASQLRTFILTSFGRPEAQAHYREALRQAAQAARDADSRELLKSGE